MNKSAFRLRPERVAKTLLQMAQQGSGFLKGSLGSGLSTPGQAAEPLFKICALAEEGFELVAFGETHHLSSAAVESSEPDPLWEHVAGICQHMEEDHSDTFEVFLKSVGVDPEGQGSITMPWIESSGFFLQLGSNSHWVPFPQECPTSQDVRKVLIKMLRELRR